MTANVIYVYIIYDAQGTPMSEPLPSKAAEDYAQRLANEYGEEFTVFKRVMVDDVHKVFKPEKKLKSAFTLRSP